MELYQTVLVVLQLLHLAVSVINVVVFVRAKTKNNRST